MELSTDVLALLNTCVRELSAALQKKEKALAKCSADIRETVHRGIEEVNAGRYEQAIRLFTRVLAEEPSYARVRLQLIDLHKKHGSHVMAILHGGTALAYATDPHTRCQIFCLTADTISRMYAQHHDDTEAVAAIQLYHNAIEADGADPVPRWNLSEFLYNVGRHADCKYELNELIHCVETSDGRFQKYVEKVLADARIAFPSEEPWSDYLQRLDRANHLLVTVQDESERVDKTRRALIVSMLALALAGVGGKMILDIMSNKEQPQGTDEKSTKPPDVRPDSTETDQTRKALNELRKEPLERINVASVDYDPEDLAAVSYDLEDLA